MKIKSKLPFLTILLLLLFAGCKKKGPAGKDGKDGNANVKSNTVTFSIWTWDNSNKYEYADFTWGEVTSSIVNSGGLFVYINTPSGWAPLPRTIYPTSSYSESQRYVYSTGTFKIIVQDSDLLQPSPALGTWTIKIVAVESSGLKTNPDLNWSDYELVKKRFNLEE